MNEANLTECRGCLQKKTRINAGRYPSKNIKYTDELGKLWSGKLCPACNHPRIVAAMQKNRSKGYV